MGTRKKNHSPLLLVFAFVIFLELLGRVNAAPCPESYGQTKCIGHEKIRITIHFKRKSYGRCQKVVQKRLIPIKCQPPMTKRSKCKNGQLTIMTIRHIVRNCSCVRVISNKHLKCPCHKSVTIRKSCHYGKRVVVTIYYKRIGHRCIRKTRVHREKCIKNSIGGGHKQSYHCKCFAFGRGSIITFDQKKMKQMSKGKCSVLMTKSNDRKCHFRVYSILYESKFRGTVVKFRRTTYRMTNAMKLYVDGHPVKVPFESKGVRVFYSGEYLQFVATKCAFTIGFNGICNHFIYLGKRYAGRVKGSCGDCDGNKRNDRMLGNTRGGCLKPNKRPDLCSPKAISVAKKLCSQLRSHRGAFGKCLRTSSKFYGGCIRDVCKAWPHKRFMYKRACQVLSIAAQACSSKGFLPRWRKKGFCALRCGRNKQYAAVMNPCPKTCENHFFGTSLLCYRLPKRDGCQCRPGYVLDGSQCVRPEKCRCIDKICADRLPRRKCKLFRSKGHCKHNPHIMNNVCKMTCGKCHPKCADQMSTHRCKQIKAEGKCVKDFYKQVCRLTCVKKSCKCPACRIQKTKCHPKYKILTVKKFCHKMDYFGKCHRRIQQRVIKCGKCPSISKVKRGKCNYCKGYRQIIRIHQYRERGGLKKCRRLIKVSKTSCHCKRQKSSFVKCIGGRKLIRFNFKKGPMGCFKCGQRRWKNVLRVIKCKRSFVKKTHCNKRTGYKNLVMVKFKLRNCKCHKSVQVKHIKCACPRPRKSKPRCMKNKFVSHITTFKLVRGKCLKKRKTIQHHIKCSRKKIVLYKCRKEDCKRFQIVIFKKIRHCQCIGRKRITYVGKCCCPKSRLRKTECRKYFKHFMKTSYKLFNGKCLKQITNWKKRCACPHMKKFKFCNKDQGEKVYGTVRFVLTKSGHCRKIVTKRKVPVLCRKLNLRHVSSCGIKLHGLKKFRRVTFTKLKRFGCGCRKIRRSILEPCGCIERKHRVVKQCPRHCNNPKTCTKGCFKRVYYYATRNVAHSGSKGNRKVKCQKRLIGKEAYRCCCPLKKRVKKRCVNHKHVQTSIYTKILKNGKCQRKVQRFSEMVDCKTGYIKTIMGRKKRDGTFTIKKIFGYIRNCKCRTRVQIRNCLWKCRKPRKRHYCDKAAGLVVTEIYYYKLIGCKCKLMKKSTRQPIKCPHHVRLIRNKCSRITKMRTKVYEKAFQIGCKCLKNRFVRKSICLCPKRRVSKFRCQPLLNKLRRKIVTFRLTKKFCIKKVRYQFKKLRCLHKVRFIKKCHPKSGVLLIVKHYRILKHCRCIKRTKLVKKAMCHCKNKPRYRRQFCDHKRNVIVKKKYFYVYNRKTKSCMKRATKKIFKFNCPRERVFTTKCNLNRKQRFLMKISYKKRACKCKKMVRKRGIPCGCRHPRRTVKHYCDAVGGQFVTVRISRRWVDKANKCVKTVITKKVPVHCKRNIRVTKSKCRNGYYVERKAYHYRNPNKCECQMRIKRRKINCHCPTKIIRKKCPKHGYFKKLIFIHRTWNHEIGNCKIHKRRVVYKRCRCPLPKKRKFCKDGMIIVEKLRFKLHGKSCVTIKRHQKFKVKCDQSARRVKHVGCNHKTCLRKIVTLAKFNHPKKCGCIWKPIHIKKCRCCRCPHRIVRTKCISHNHYRTKIIYFTPRKRCSTKCKRHVKILRRPVKCHQKIKVHWSKCNRNTCRKFPIYSKVMHRNCRCRKIRHRGRPVTCCCKSKPMKKVFCHKGKIIKQIIFYRLKNHKCIKKMKQNIKMKKCKRHLIRRYGHCNRENCFRKVWHFKSHLHHDSCTCKMKKRLAKMIPCCCLKKPYKRRFCDGKCHIYKFYRFSFSKASKSCVKHVKTIRRCPKCPSRRIKIGRCNKSNCWQKYFKTIWFVKKCRCHKTVNVKTRICCCPRPEFTKRCDHNRGEIVRRKIYYILTHGKCSKRIKEKRVQIKCKKSHHTRALKCDRLSCKRRFITTSQYRRGCKCKRQKRVHSKICCCPKSVSHVKCVKHIKIVKFTKRWILTRKGCMPMKSKRVLKALNRCKNRHVIGKCNPHSRHRTITTLLYKPKKCKCHLSHRKMRRYLCACPKPIIRVSKCNKRTCKEKKFFIRFHSLHKGKCKRQVKVLSRRCCCSHKKWVKHVCNSVTGNKEIFHYQKVFHKRDRTCKVKRRKFVKYINCRSPTRVRAGKCNPRNGLKKVVFQRLVKDRMLCKCRRVNRVKLVLCSCKHKGCRKFMKCYNGYILKKRVCWRLKNKRCVRVIKIQKKKIVCSRRKYLTRKCNRKTCKEVITKHFIVRENCKCVKRFSLHKRLCCCPKPTEIKKCTGKSHSHKLVVFSLNSKKTACKRMVKHRPMFVKCKRRKVIQSRKCDHKTCKKHFRAILFKVKNCHCKAYKMKKWHRRCCCPKNRKKIKCYKKYGVIYRVSFHYKLVDGFCLTRKEVIQNRIVCRPGRAIRGKCDSRTRKRHIRFEYYKRVGCKCIKKIKRSQELCACPRSHMKKQSCKNRRKRKVFAVYYSMKKYYGRYKCMRNVKLLYRDMCRCPKHFAIKKCVDGVIQTRVVSYKLVHRLNRQMCHKREQSFQRVIKCSKPSTVRTKCHNFIRKYITTYYKNIHCKCKKFFKIRKEACKCHLKNRHYKFCKDGAIFRVREKYFSQKYSKNCLLHKTFQAHPIVCSDEVSIRPISKCTIRKHFGFYKQLKRSWLVQKGCKCVKKFRRFTKLCRCRKKISKKLCIADDCLKIYKKIYYRINGRCLPREETLTKDINCSDPPIVVRKSKCIHNPRTKRCHQIITIKKNFVKNCKCRCTVIHKSRICCKPRDKKRKYCDKERGEWVTVLTSFSLVKGYPLFLSETVLINSKKVVKKVKRSSIRVICSKTRVFERCGKSGKWTRKIIRYKRFGCKCKRKIQIVTGRCKCPAPIIVKSRCHKYHRRITKIFYRIINHKCVKFSRTKKVRCACPKPVKRLYCDGHGRWVRCKTTFQFLPESKTCRLHKKCTRWHQRCPSKHIRRGKCNRETHKRKVELIRYIKNKASCKCRHRVRSWHQYCSCKHLNKKHTRCEGGVIVTTSIIHRLKRGQCLFTRFKQRVKVVCSPVKKIKMKCDRYRGKASTGMRTIKNVWSENVNCKCHPRRKLRRVPCDCKIIHGIKRRKVCKSRSVMVLKTTYYVLKRKMCVKRSKYKKFHIRCPSKSRVRKSKCLVNERGIGYRHYQYYKLRARHCKCVWKLINRSNKICKCPPSKKKTKCSNHKHWVTKIKTYYPDRRRKHCRNKILTRIRPVFCNRSWKKIRKCNKISCRNSITHFKQYHHHCKCKLKRKTRHFLCCCPKPTPKRTLCNYERHMWITRWKTYHLSNGHCIHKIHQSTRRVRCERVKPRIIVGKCKGTRRVITIITKKKRGCKCVKKIRRKTHRCGCPKRIRFRKGKCKNSWAVDKFLHLQFNKVTKKCIWTVIRTRRRRCSCPRSITIRKCKNHNRKVVKIVKFILRKHTNSCERKVTKFQKVINCSPHPRLIHRISGKCSRSTNYRQVDIKVFIVAKNCKCHKFQRRITWPCKCFKINPPRVRKICRGDYILRIKRISYNIGKQCRNKEIKTRIPIICKGKEIRRGKCNRKTGKRPIITYLKRVSMCKCVWRSHRVRHVVCQCPRPRKFTRCVKNAWQTVKIQFRLVRNRCIKEKSVIRKQIRCRLGVKVKHTRCFYFRGYKKIIKTKHWVNKCKCLKSVSVRKCQCVCPKAYSYKQCNPEKGIIRHIHVNYVLKNCRCIIKRQVSTSSIKCPVKTIIHTKCRSKGDSRNNDSYKDIVMKYFPRHGCKCGKKVRRKTILCGCAPRPHKFVKCVDNTVIQTLHTRRVLKHNKCVRLTVRKTYKKIYCGKRSINIHCNKKTGKETVMITIPKTVNCHCKKLIRTKHRRCKCDRSLRLIKRIPCNKRCRKTKIYRFFVLRNHKCKPKYVAKSKTCCCPRKRSVKRVCLYHKGLIQTTIKILKLISHHCETVTKVRRRAIHCEKRPRVTKDKRPDGTLKITISKTIRVGCKCKRVHRVVYKKWNCPRGHSKTRCVDAPEPAFEHTKVTYRRTKYSTCKRVVKVMLQPIKCSESLTQWSSCKHGKNAKYKIQTSITHFVHKCKCKRRVEKRCKLCSCRSPITKRYCDKKHGAKVKLTFKFLPHGCKICKPVKYKNSIKVNCDPTPRYFRTTKCHPIKGVKNKIFVFKKRVGCSCKKRFLSKPCRCRCKSKKRLVKCVSHKLLLFKTISYKLSKCRCHRQVTVKHKRIHCRRTRTLVSKCHSAGNCHKTITTIKYRHHKCKCIKSIKRRRKRCCCPGPSKRKFCRNGMIITMHRKYILHKNRCLSKLKKSSYKIRCKEGPIVRVSGPCIHNVKDIKYGRQRYTIIKTVRQHCKCVKIKRHVYKKCLCPLKKAAEVIFLIDESVNSRQPFFRKRVSKFLMRATAYFPIGRHSIRVGLIKYSEHPSVILNLNHKHDHSHIYSAIKHIPYSGSRSNLDQALHLVTKKILPRARKMVQVNVFIITDGVSRLHYGSTLKEAIRLKNKGVRIHVVAVGPKIRNEQKLKNLVVKGSYQYLGDMKYIKHLPEIVAGRLCGKVCPPSSVKIKKCSKSTGCKGRIYFGKFVYNHRQKRCVKKSFVETRRCCCPFPGKKWVKCVKNRMIKFQTYWKFFSGKCHKDLLQEDISGPIYARCRPRSRVHVGKCRRNNYRTLTYIKRKVINCRCRTFKKVIKQLCRCPKPIHKKFCRNHKYIVKQKVSFHLRKHKCISRRSEHKSRIVCPDPIHFKSPCDKMSCKRRISYAVYKENRCKCRKHVRHHFVRCCCKPRTIRQKRCVNHKYYLHTKRWVVFDPSRKECVHKSKRRMQNIYCNTKPVIRVSRCGSKHRGKLMFRTIVKTWKVHHHCQCLKKRIVVHKPCACRGGRKFKICKIGDIIGIKINYILKGNKCRKRRRIYSKKRIVCSRTRRVVRGQCSIIPKSKPKGHIYRKITIYYQVRSNCKCHTRRHKRIQLCRCPKSHKIQRCHRHHKLLKYIFSYRLHKGKYCKKHVTKRTKMLSCPKPLIIKSKCHKKKMRIHVKLWKMIHCRCKSHSIRRIVACKLGKTGYGRRIILNYDKCVDLLPKSKCKDLASYPHNICKTNGKFRDYFCRKTCRKCQSCKSKRIDFRIHYMSCLVTDKRYKKRFLVRFYKNKPYFYCKQKCRDNPNCLSFDYYLPQSNLHKGLRRSSYRRNRRYGNCVLNTVDPKNLITELYPQKGKIGATVKDLIRHRSKKCILSRKICVKECPQSQVRASRKCHCLQTKKRHVPHCFRMARIFYYKRDKSSGKCIKRQWKGLIPCKKRVCDDFKSKAYCRAMKKKGKCLMIKVAKACRRSCSKCKCRGNFEYRTKCDNKGRRKHVRISYRRHRHHKKCVINLKHFTKQCQYCPEGKFRVIHPCVKNKRMITTVISHLKQNGKCGVRTRRHIYSCHKCPTEDKVIVGHCKDGVLRVTTYFTVRVKSCCKQMTNVRLFKCQNCPRKRVMRTKCSHGSRLRHIIYYVRYLNGTKKCAKRIHTRMEKCKSWKYCRDEMSKLDCLNFHKHGFCRKQRMDSKRLCRKTCGMC